ncbi:MAG: hypothetical protein Q8Q89_05025 [bacterium]|nr:hypothetical protein [bacterium]
MFPTLDFESGGMGAFVGAMFLILIISVCADLVVKQLKRIADALEKKEKE